MEEMEVDPAEASRLGEEVPDSSDWTWDRRLSCEQVRDETANAKNLEASETWLQAGGRT